MRSIGAAELAAQLRDGSATEAPHGIRLGLNDIAALRATLAGADVGEHEGLRELQARLTTT